MGTYTANYQLYMPSIGEQGWGDLMNGNLTTIDTTMKSLSNSIGTLETETDAVEERVTKLEAGEFETVNCSGNIKADSFNGVSLKSTITVTPNENYIFYSGGYGSYIVNRFVVLPLNPFVKYTGSIKIYNHTTNGQNANIIYVLDTEHSEKGSISLGTVRYGTITFTDASCVILYAGNSVATNCTVCGFTLS